MAYTGKKPVDFVDVTESQTFKVTESLDVQGNELVLDADGDTSITSDTDDVIDFRTAGSDRWQILANGNLKAATNGLGIDFSASEGSGASASVLDDYEEGTWTPACTVGTLSEGWAYYIKVGRLVTAYAQFGSFSNRTSSTALAITGLPFTSSGLVGNQGTVLHQYVSRGGDHVVAYIQPNTTQIELYACTASNQFNSIRHQDLSSNSSQFYITINYYSQ